MAHKTLIGGTAYEISGGKTLIDGTAYSIDKGKALVDGTAYEVGFGSAMATITVSGYADGYATITHNEMIYSDEATFVAKVGDTILCSVQDCYDYAYVSVNGDWVASSYGDDVYYEYTVVSNATIYLYSNSAGEKKKRVGSVDIIET